MGSEQRRGFCPSLQAPMASGDGLIVRLSVHALASAELRALVQLAAELGNGVVEITRRGKLQLRGLREDTLPNLRAALRVAEAPAALVVNPLHGLHAACAPLESLASELAAVLAGARLADKFGVVLDSGGVLRDVPADIHVDVSAHGAAMLRIAGEHVLGQVAASQVARAVQALLEAHARHPECSRARALVAAHGLQELAASIQAFTAALPPTAARPLATEQLIGQHASPAWLGLGLAFGSADSATWLALAELAERFGSGHIRFTPFRGVILPGVRSREAVIHARETGWITDPSDPLLRAIACPGAPACASARGETRRLARELLPLLAAGARVHVSGCSKSCAHSGAAPVTVVCERDGVRLGFDASAAQVAETPVFPLEKVRERLFALARASENGQARASVDTAR
jgi:precorrin-3B synthase